MYRIPRLNAADLDLTLKNHGYTDGEISQYFERLSQIGEAIPDTGRVSLIRQEATRYTLYVEEEDDKL